MKKTPEQIIEIIDEPKEWLKLTPSQIRDLSDYCKKLKAENEQLRICVVSQRRELLFFGEWIFDQFDLNKDVPVAKILENYLKLKNNCG